jgi:hypothetical protein
VGRIRVTISSDGLAAEVTADAGPPCTRAELDGAIAAAGVRFGIEEGAIPAIVAALADPAHKGRHPIAKGTAAEAGQDGRLDILDPPGVQPGQLHDDGSIDYRERHFLRPAEADAVIARILAPRPGTAGRSVRGDVVPAKPVRQARVQCGPGVRLDGDRVIAQRGGVIASDVARIDVVPLFAHSGDVDYRSGNLHTEGSLAVRGDVGIGFTATADADVHVGGAVLSGTIEAGGHVRIEQGVLGRGGVAVAGGDLYCRHATSSRLQAGGTITLGDDATNCRLFATAVRAQAGRGTVFGGEVRARREITVRTVGTAAGSVTRLLVGDVTDASAELLRSTLADQKLAERARQRASSDSAPGRKALRQAVRIADANEPQRLRLLQQQRELLRTASITIEDTLHTGVTIAFGERSIAPVEPRHRVRYRWDPDTDTIVEENLP